MGHVSADGIVRPTAAAANSTTATEAANRLNHAGDRALEADRAHSYAQALLTVRKHDGWRVVLHVAATAAAPSPSPTRDVRRCCTSSSLSFSLASSIPSPRAVVFVNQVGLRLCTHQTSLVTSFSSLRARSPPWDELAPGLHDSPMFVLAPT